MIALLHAAARLASFLLLAALAVAGAAAAIFSLGASGDLSLPGLARQLDLSALRGQVDDLLTAVEASGPVAMRSALAGLGAVAVGFALLAGALWPRRERLVVLSGEDEGVLAARRRALAQAAAALAEQTRGVRVRRAKVRPYRRRPGGRLVLKVNRPATLPRDEARKRVGAALAPLTSSFSLRTLVQSRRGGRVQ